MTPWIRLISALIVCSTATSSSVRGAAKRNAKDGFAFNLEVNLDGKCTPCTAKEELEVKTILWALVDTWVPIELGKLDPKNPELSVVELECDNCSDEERRTLQEEIQTEQEQARRRLPGSYRYSGTTRCNRLNNCDSSDSRRFRRTSNLDQAVAMHVAEEFQVFLDNQADDFCMLGNVDLEFSLAL